MEVYCLADTAPLAVSGWTIQGPVARWAKAHWELLRQPLGFTGMGGIHKRRWIPHIAIIGGNVEITTNGHQIAR